MIILQTYTDVTSCFPVSRMFEVEGKHGVILTLGDGWSNPSLGRRGGFCRKV
jgi:hypothetical protein